MTQLTTVVVVVTGVAGFFLSVYYLAPSTFPLDMVPEAVDDNYDGCAEEMKKIVEEKYFDKEDVGIFKRYWGHQTIENCSNKPVNPQVLTKNHRKAVCLQTSKYMYKEFNEAVRTSKNTYGSTFPYHYFHYWLTTAIQILRKNQECHTAYRRSKDIFTGNVNDIIRFGTFASSSTKPNLYTYGSKTCFKIKTCLGASVEHYEMYDDQREVLIPPYETFTIINISKGKGSLKDCEKVFILEHAGEKSNLKCKLVPPDIRPTDGAHVIT